MEPSEVQVIMVRSGLHDLNPWDSPDTGWTDPMADPEIRREIRGFLCRLYASSIRWRGASASV